MSFVSVAGFLGLSQLAVDGARTITGVVEDVHATVDPFTRSGAGRMGGVAGLVYRSMRAGYSVAGVGIRAALNRAVPVAEALPGSTPERGTAQAILNGVWGDHLEATGNPLAIQMSIRHEGVPLVLAADSVRPALPAPGRRLLVLVHGLCMNDLGWRQGGHDHGAELARELGYTALYLRYNSGLHVSTNGQRLADLLEQLVEAWPEPVEELAIIGYSMGGLVARSAVYYGTASGHKWPQHLRRLVFLGTPHHGSRLERAGSLADALLNSTRYSAPFGRLGATRSAGITDLRHGSVVDEDWQGLDRFGHHDDTRCPVPLPSGIECYSIGGSIGSRAGDLRGRVLGDGIVPLESALGVHKNPEHCLAFGESSLCVSYETDHMGLLKQPEVYAKIREWLAA